MSTSLIRFLAVLATDPGILAEYMRNPGEVMHEAGLSDSDIAALRSGDPSVLEAQLQKDGVTLGVCGPVHDPLPVLPTHTHLVILDAKSPISVAAKPSEPPAAAKDTGSQSKPAGSAEAPAQASAVQSPKR